MSNPQICTVKLGMISSPWLPMIVGVAVLQHSELKEIRHEIKEEVESRPVSNEARVWTSQYQTMPPPNQLAISITSDLYHGLMDYQRSMKNGRHGLAFFELDWAEYQMFYRVGIVSALARADEIIRAMRDMDSPGYYPIAGIQLKYLVMAIRSHLQAWDNIFQAAAANGPDDDLRNYVGCADGLDPKMKDVVDAFEHMIEIIQVNPSF